MNKKGQVFTILVTISVFLALTAIFIAFDHKYDNIGQEIGTYASALIKAYQQQEEDLLFLDETSKMAAQKALINIGESGGLLTFDCSTSIYPLWNDESKTCFPDYKENLKDEFAGNLYDSLTDYAKPSINKIFNINIKQNKTLKFIGTTNDKTTVTIKTTSSTNCETPITGEPSITAEEIEAILEEKESPAQGKARVFYDEGVRTGIDPVFALAFFNHESQMGKEGVAVRTQSIGNRRPKSTCSSADCKDYVESNNYRWSCLVEHCDACDFIDCPKEIEEQDQSELAKRCFCGYNDWSESIKDWFNLIKTEYVDKGLDSVEKIIPIYAPSNENDVNAYIAYVKSFASKYKDIPCRTTLGSYSYRSGFSTRINYNISIYDSLKEFSNKVIDGCKDDIKNCLQEEINNYNEIHEETILPLEECEEGAQNVFYTFVENLEDCKSAWSNNCKCEITEDYGNQYTMTFETNNVNFYSETGFWFWGRKENQMSYDLNPYFEIPEEYDFEKTHLKKESDKFTFVKDSSLRECPVAKQTFRLCAKTKYKFPVFEEGGLKFKESKIKFALTLIDKVPPAKIVELQNNKDEETNIGESGEITNIFNNILLEWNHDSKDIASFEIYYSEEEFTTAKREDLIGEFFITEAKQIALPEQSNVLYKDNGHYSISIMFPTPELQLERALRFALGLPKDADHYFAVIAKDNFENKNSTVITTKIPAATP